MKVQQGRMTKTERRIYYQAWMAEVRSHTNGRVFPDWSKSKEFHSWRCRVRRGSAEYRRTKRLAKLAKKRKELRRKLRSHGRSCTKCGEQKLITEFAIDRSHRNPSGRVYRCKQCEAEVARERYASDIEKSRAASRKKHQKLKKERPVKYREMLRAQYENRTPQRRMIENMRKRFREILKLAQSNPSERFGDVCGCTVEDLRTHLESQFTKRMSWENYGEYWHVDHIMPASSFDHSDPEQVRRCWHFTNLRPLEAKGNISKGAKILDPQLQLAV